MRGGDAEEAAADAGQMFDRLHGRDRPATNGLGGACDGIERRRLAAPSNVIGTPAAMNSSAESQADREEYVGNGAPKVEVEVAHVRIAAQAADDGREARRSRRRPK